ncbi:hypothetical protein SEPCBS57363_004863 [Sporothrix epigloea]|uniref:Uncharacterized protein n=1 Tax=Sporothrix epigloea TaxID=1892477 RepID=A0ABP0DUP0_9PEZI
MPKRSTKLNDKPPEDQTCEAKPPAARPPVLTSPKPAKRLPGAARNALTAAKKTIFVAPPPEIPDETRVAWLEKCWAMIPAANKDLTAMIWSGKSFAAATYGSTLSRDRALTLVSKERFLFSGKLFSLILRPFGERPVKNIPSVWSVDYPFKPEDADVLPLIQAIRSHGKETSSGIEVPEFDIRLVLNRLGVYTGRLLEQRIPRPGKRIKFGGDSFRVIQEGKASCVVCCGKDHTSPSCVDVAATHRGPIIATSTDADGDAPAPPAKSGDEAEKGPWGEKVARVPHTEAAAQAKTLPLTPAPPTSRPKKRRKKTRDQPVPVDWAEKAEENLRKRKFDEDAMED